MAKIEWYIPITTVSEANTSEHWTKKRQRHKQQQFFIRSLFRRETSETPLPCVITMTRVSPRLLDDDNLRTAFKWIRDEISECIFPEKTSHYISKSGRKIKIKGRADSDPRIKWEYAQEKGKTLGVKIEIAPHIADLSGSLT